MANLSKISQSKYGTGTYLESPSFEAFSSDFRASPLWPTYQQEVVHHAHVTLEEAKALLLAALQCRWETLDDEPLVVLRTILHYKVLSTVSESTPGPDRPVALRRDLTPQH